MDDVTSAASNFSLLDNGFDGNNVMITAQAGQTVPIASSGKLTIQYNDFQNSGGDMIEPGASNEPQVDLIHHNLFANIGVNTVHSDTIQWYNTTTGGGSDIGCNTVYENINEPGRGNGAPVPLAAGVHHRAVRRSGCFVELAGVPRADRRQRRVLSDGTSRKHAGLAQRGGAGSWRDHGRCRALPDRHPSWRIPHDPTSTAGIVPSLSATWTSLPQFSTVGAAGIQAKRADL